MVVQITAVCRHSRVTASYSTNHKQHHVQNMQTVCELCKSYFCCWLTTMISISVLFLSVALERSDPKASSLALGGNRSRSRKYESLLPLPQGSLSYLQDNKQYTITTTNLASKRVQIKLVAWLCY